MMTQYRCATTSVAGSARRVILSQDQLVQPAVSGNHLLLQLVCMHDADHCC